MSGQVKQCIFQCLAMPSHWKKKNQSNSRYFFNVFNYLIKVLPFSPNVKTLVFHVILPQCCLTCFFILSHVSPTFLSQRWRVSGRWGPFLSSKDQFFRLSSDQRNSMVTFVAAQKATLCGESISPEHQHIQSYRDDQGMIQVWNGVDGDGAFRFPFLICLGIVLGLGGHVEKHRRSWFLKMVCGKICRMCNLSFFLAWKTLPE